jgi:hypothetical protein
MLVKFIILGKNIRIGISFFFFALFTFSFSGGARARSAGSNATCMPSRTNCTIAASVSCSAAASLLKQSFVTQKQKRNEQKKDAPGSNFGAQLRAQLALSALSEQLVRRRRAQRVLVRRAVRTIAQPVSQILCHSVSASKTQQQTTTTTMCLPTSAAAAAAGGTYIWRFASALLRAASRSLAVTGRQCSLHALFSSCFTSAHKSRGPAARTRRTSGGPDTTAPPPRTFFALATFFLSCKRHFQTPKTTTTKETTVQMRKSQNRSWFIGLQHNSLSQRLFIIPKNTTQQGTKKKKNKKKLTWPVFPSNSFKIRSVFSGFARHDSVVGFTLTEPLAITRERRTTKKRKKKKYFRSMTNSSSALS